MSQKYRLAAGGQIDRSTPLRFRFNNAWYEGFRGDTLASALLANGVRIVARSFKYHRPRGIVAAGADEPNAILQIGSGAAALPDRLATQVELTDGLAASSHNHWPGLRVDLLATLGLAARFLPPGFYYKTFMRPRFLWPLYEQILRQLSGHGTTPTGPDPDSYEHRNAHCDVLVVGGGPAGISAALQAGRRGCRVILVDDQRRLGGSLVASSPAIDGQPALDWVAASATELSTLPEVRVLTGTSAAGYYEHNFVTAVQALPRPGPAERLWRIRTRHVVLATGAIERPLVFDGNDRPGVMLASGLSGYLHQYAVVPGRLAVLFTTNDSAYQLCLDLLAAGVTVSAVVDPRPVVEGPLPAAIRERGVPIYPGHVVAAARGRRGVRGVTIAPIRENGRELGRRVSLSADLLAMSGGWSPTIHLHAQSGGRPAWDERRGAFVPGPPTQPQASAGACNGSFTLDECLQEGTAAGAAAANAGGAGGGPIVASRCMVVAAGKSVTLWNVPGAGSPFRQRRRFVDVQEDVTVADIAVALKEGYRSIEHVKRYATVGMGTGQGKLANVNAIGIAADLMEKEIPAVGYTTYRPPFTPLGIGTVAGRNIGELADPVRKTPLHTRNVAAGAVFENVGQWHRAWFYPRAIELMDEAVARECKAVRTGVGLMDYSTLGKIEIVGPDAIELLQRVYINDWKKLAIGACRYGVMLGENGMVLDDGVTARLGDDHFMMFTSTGGAAKVLSWLELWLQTEWPELQVYLTSVSEQWADIALAGPRSRDVLAKLTTDIDLSAESFRFMAFRDGTIAGVPVRVYRISFVGELSYEITCATDHAGVLWDALAEAGSEYDITPYGTEAMHVLRAEKGFFIVGQETDGSVTPDDLGVGGMCSTRKDFLGKRSLQRPDSLRGDRKQLVGLFTEDPSRLLPEGAQIVDQPGRERPLPMIGHVTSSYRSATLGRSIALAMIAGGRARMGETVSVPLMTGTVSRATIVPPVFYDPKGERQRG